MSKKKIELIILGPLILYSLYCSLIIGPSWDEFYHYKNGDNIFNYIFSFGTREYHSANFKFHFGLYDFLASFFSKNFTKSYLVESHHIFNLIFSIFAVFGVYQITKRLFSRSIGKIAFIVCFFNPVYFGHFSNNPKDTIIAFCYIWIFNISLKYIYNNKNKKYLVYLILLFSLGLGIRLTFLFSLFPIFIIILFELYLKNKIFISQLYKFIKDLFLIIIFSFIITFIFWPDSHSDLLRLPFSLVKNYFLLFFDANFGLPLGILNGDFYETTNTPSRYIFVMLFYKLPIYILFSIIFLPIFLYARNEQKKVFKAIFYIFLQILFPILIILIFKPGINDGLRYFLYILPFFAILSSISIYYIFLSRFIILKFFFIFLFLYNIFIFFKLTPYQYTFINSLNGKFSNNLNKFENDYWGASVKELLLKAKNNSFFKENKIYYISTCGVNNQIVKYYLNKEFDFEYKFVNSNEMYDYMIFVNRVDTTLEKVDLNSAKTCYDNFFRSDIIKVERNGLPIAFISN